MEASPPPAALGFVLCPPFRPCLHYYKSRLRGVRAQSRKYHSRLEMALHEQNNVRRDDMMACDED